MSETVTIGNATLIWGDSREIVPTLARPAAIITDPPYGLGDKMQGGTWGAKAAFKEMMVWDNAPPPEADLATLIATGCPCIFWGGNYFTLPPSRCWLIWDKVNAVPTMADFEMAWTNIDRPAKRYMGQVGRVENGHPTEKPVALMRWCITQARVPAGGMILDPYAGSGSTLVAAVQMGYPCTGIEMERRYFDTACKRIEDAKRQGTLDIPRPKLPVEPPALLDL